MAGAPRFEDVVDPTPEEIRSWAYSCEPEPMQDWDVVIADLDNVQVLLDLVADPGCPARSYLLASIYCMVGHADHLDTRLSGAAAAAALVGDPWVSTWAGRVRRVLTNPSDFSRDDWCGEGGLRTDPAG